MDERSQLLPLDGSAEVTEYNSIPNTRKRVRYVKYACGICIGALAVTCLVRTSKSAQHVGSAHATALKPSSLWVNPGSNQENSGSSSAHNSTVATSHSTHARPNIVFMYLDDQGYNDVGSGSTDYIDLTPRISTLASEGLWLRKYYGQEVCTPSRAALLTGVYPIHTGMQYGMISSNDPWGLPTQFWTMPQHLKRAGNYTTHLIGKWHLGHFSASRLPLQRGFDTFFGYYSGFTSYFSHVAEISLCDDDGGGCWYDLRNGDTPVKADGEYNAYMFQKQVHDLINAHGALSKEKKAQQPFFLYYALGVVHEPLQVPEEVLLKNADRISHIRNTQRRMHAGMTIVLDDSVGEVISALKENDMYEDSLIILASDNGANPTVQGGGSNWPLRGKKGDFFEGGIRVHAVVRSPAIPLKLRGGSYNGLFHCTDWLPTIVAGALGAPEVLKPIENTLDGINQWHRMISVEHGPFPRTEIVHSVTTSYSFDENDAVVSFPTGAIRRGDYKLLVHVYYEPVWTIPKTPTVEVNTQLTSLANTSAGLLRTKTLRSLSKQHKDYLFNIEEDPEETTDLKDTYPDIYNDLRKAFDEYHIHSVPPVYCAVDDTSRAERAFEETQFLGPWRDDDVEVEIECMDLASTLQIDHTMKLNCIYNMIPAEECMYANLSSM